jgi:hypothetical protein
MTEEDTFNALRKPTIFEMMSLVIKRNRETGYMPTEEWHKFMKNYGWTSDEYNKMMNKHFNEYYSKYLK